MKKMVGKLSVLVMALVMVFSMAGCATYGAVTAEKFCTALDELGYNEVADAGKVADVNTAMMSFAAFGGGGYLHSYSDPYDTSEIDFVRGKTEEVMCITSKGTRYLLLIFDDNDNAKFYYDTMKNQIEAYDNKEGLFTTKAGLNAECYVFAGEIPSFLGSSYCYGGFYYKDNTVTIIDTYDNDITCKSQVNMMLDKLGLPRP